MPHETWSFWTLQNNSLFNVQRRVI